MKMSDRIKVNGFTGNCFCKYCAQKLTVWGKKVGKKVFKHTHNTAVCCAAQKLST